MFAIDHSGTSLSVSNTCYQIH